MKTSYLLICLLCLCPVVCAQWQDNFADGDFSLNPAWRGDDEKFIIDGGMLRLNGQTAGKAYLSVASDVIENATWEFECRMSFKPSSSNYAKVYLVSDQADLNAPLNGYFLRIGSVDNDICLFRQDGTRTEKLITGRIKRIDAATNQVKIKVTRDDQGYWILQSAVKDSKYESEGEALDNRIKTSSHFGIVCIYTITRSTGFYFGDFITTGQTYTDTEKPVVSLIEVNNPEIHIHFSKEMSPVLPPYERFFRLNESTCPTKVIRDERLNRFTLFFAESLTCGIRYHLSIQGLPDLHGNIIRDTTYSFALACMADKHDIVVNEIMANPAPSVGLPEYEYIELYNRSGKNLEMDGWTFTYGNTVKTFPQHLFPANSYLLLVHPDAEASIKTYGATLPLLGSQTAISNAGQYLLLMDSYGTAISWVAFTTDWYRDLFKSDGGWSLEQIDPEQTCSHKFNWNASNDRKGGTPGMLNSVDANNPDTETPEIWRLAVQDEHTIILYVSKSLGALKSPVAISLNPEIRITDMTISGKHFNELLLQLQSPLQAGQWYGLSIGEALYDCAGYQINATDIHFKVPQETDSLDLVINEILFNPLPDGDTYIELFNRSQKTVRVSDLLLSLRNANGKLSTPVILSDEPFLLLPGQYLVVSRKPDAIMQQFDGDRKAMLPVLNMPILGKESGRVVLLNKSLRIIDEIRYDSKQHSDFLKTGSGISLEKLHPDRNSFDPGNWHTAAQTSGFGTPGRQNSQYMVPGTTQSGITLHPEVFSPDNDGIDDVLQINYSFDTPSLMAEVMIFDAKGRKIRQLAHRELLATEGSILWDGTDDRGRKALTGVYIIYFHAYNPDGTDQKYKLPCVLAGKRI